VLDLKINALFATYFEALDYGQEQQLEKSLKDDLTSEPILWWHNPATNQDEILDGHNRYAIAKKHKLDIQFHEKHFENEDAALLFIIRTQTTRRNLWNREVIVKKAVDLEVKLGKTKTQAVQDVAEQLGVAESTVWEDVKPKSATQQFFDDKKVYERDLERVRNKEVEKLKQRAKREGWVEDEGKLESEWGKIETEIQEQFAEATSRLESTASAIQTAQEANGGSPMVGGKRRAKKSTASAAARRNGFKKALTYISKFQNDVLYFWHQNGCGSVDIADVSNALKVFGQLIEAEQETDKKAAKKKKFGR